MKRSTKDKAKGTFHQVKGGVKQTLGRVTSNRRLEAEGAAEKIGGKIQEKIGQVEKIFKKWRHEFGRAGSVSGSSIATTQNKD